MAVTVDRFTTRHGAVWPIEEAGEGPPVLALHGVGGGAYFFRGLAERLGGAYRVLAPELPSGLTPDGGAEPVSMEQWAAGLSELVAARLSEPFVVVGHSLGTILALELWRHRPAGVRAMVFVGGLPAVRAAARARLSERVANIVDHGMAGWGARVSPGVFGAKTFETRPEMVGLFERLLEAHPPATYIRNINALLVASATDVVPTVDVPCLSISGTEDAYAPPEAVADFLRLLPSPCEQVLMEEVGHMPFFEAPEAFAQMLGAFLARLPETAARRE